MKGTYVHIKYISPLPCLPSKQNWEKLKTLYPKDDMKKELWAEKHSDDNKLISTEHAWSY